MGQSSKFHIKICVKYRRTFFDSYSWTFNSDLNKSKCWMGHRKDTVIQSSTSWSFSSECVNAIHKKKYHELRLPINAILG